MLHREIKMNVSVITTIGFEMQSVSWLLDPCSSVEAQANSDSVPYASVDTLPRIQQGQEACNGSEGEMVVEE